MGLRLTKQTDTGFTAEYWNMGRIADITRGTRNVGTEEHPDMQKYEKVDVYMRLYKDRQSYLDGATPIEKKLFSVTYGYDQLFNRGAMYEKI